MAGVWCPACCKGCSCTLYACGDKGKRSDSSLLGRRLSEDSSRHQLLQKWASTWSSVSGDRSVAYPERMRCEEPAEPAEEDRPLVFLCSGCRRPVGDSLSWVTSQEDTNCILLRCVSCNVSVDKEQILSKRENENGCVLEALYCTGCSLSLGYVYRCTPTHLDYRRDLFCLSVEAIERQFATVFETRQVPIAVLDSQPFPALTYSLGSSGKQIVSEDKELFNLESRAEIEKSLEQMEDVLKALQTKLWEVESKLSFTGCQS
ncbi:hypothetical protein MC885_011055 [Smutsia gigantea]|nr:hypothetical protein MC885_011055 [Smutsia gigantea]